MSDLPEEQVEISGSTGSPDSPQEKTPDDVETPRPSHNKEAEYSDNAAVVPEEFDAFGKWGVKKRTPKIR